MLSHQLLHITKFRKIYLIWKFLFFILSKSFYKSRIRLKILSTMFKIQIYISNWFFLVTYRFEFSLRGMISTLAHKRGMFLEKEKL